MTLFWTSALALLAASFAVLRRAPQPQRVAVRARR